ncbi:hypothetical protein ABT272_44930 [Streptomyces sp900105245]|uniref:Transposase n=1 Tax=Streptomyces sp. 900105245 TaxID=3154379 RepID=A0ABV1ULL9_9ACTN
MTADEACGQEWKFHRLLKELGVGYVVVVPKSQQVKSLAGCSRIDEIPSEAPQDAWQRISCSDDAGPTRLWLRERQAAGDRLLWGTSPLATAEC